MTFKHEIRSVLLPLWRWAWLLVGLVVVAVVAARFAIKYMVPMYRASGTIQIDNRDFGIESFQLFAGQGAATAKPAASGLTEMEVLQSRTLIGRAIDSLGWGVTYFRVGEVKTAELYTQTPFFLQITEGDSAFLDKRFWLIYRSDSSFVFKKTKEKDAPDGPTIRFNEPAIIGSTTLVFSKNTLLLDEKPNALRPGDHFEIVWRSREKMIDDILGHELFVKPIDKEATLLKVVYSDPVAQKTSDFVGALLHAYIDQSKSAKVRLARQTLTFLDEQLADVADHLRQSEEGLASYRAQSGIAASEMEMDAAFKERMQHNLREVNYDLQEAELRRVFDFLRSGRSLEGFSPNFEALNDAIFKETYLRAQSLELQKQDLAIRYTAKSDEVVNTQNKINQLRAFLNESVANTMANINEKKNELGRAVQKINRSLQVLPEKQRRDASLGRDVKMNEELYTHLLERRTALAVAAASDESFHRIIDEPTLPVAPYSPNKSILTGLAVLVALIVGMALAYLFDGRLAVVRSAADLEHLHAWPVLGQVFRMKPKKNGRPLLPVMDELLSELDILLKQKTAESGPGCRVLVVGSARPGEGKSFLTTYLARSFAAAGRRVLVVDADLRKGDLALRLKTANFGGVSALIQHEWTPNEAILLTPVRHLHLLPAGQFHAGCTAPALSAAFEKIIRDLHPNYDLILVDTPPIDLLPDALPLMQHADFNLFLARSGKTPMRLIRKLVAAFQGAKPPTVFFVLTDVTADRARAKKHQQLYAGYPQLVEEEVF